MNNSARHVLGAVLGLIAAPLAVGLVMWGMHEASTTTRLALETSWSGVAAIVVGAALLGVLVGGRISPLASLIPGVIFTVIGLLWAVSAREAFDLAEELPRSIRNEVLTWGISGLFLMLGVLLVAASVPPSRWRAVQPAAAGPRDARPGAFGTPPPFQQQQPQQFQQRGNTPPPFVQPPNLPPQPGHYAPPQQSPQQGQYAPPQQRDQFAPPQQQDQFAPPNRQEAPPQFGKPDEVPPPGPR